MPLLDHFHPPLSEHRHWHAFHNSWATYLSSQLNALLPEGYFAEANVQFGVEIDVAAFQEHTGPPPQAGWTGCGRTRWARPANQRRAQPRMWPPTSFSDGDTGRTS